MEVPGLRGDVERRAVGQRDRRALGDRAVAPKASVPATMFVGPVYVLDAVRVSVPGMAAVLFSVKPPSMGCRRDAGVQQGRDDRIVDAIGIEESRRRLRTLMREFELFPMFTNAEEGKFDTIKPPLRFKVAVPIPPVIARAV